MAAEAVAVDIGGTKIAAAIVSADGTVRDRVIADTPADADGIVATVAAAAQRLRRDRHQRVGVGAAGLVDRDGTVRYAPNLPWRDLPLGRELSDRLGCAVAVENDATTAAWAEYRVGAGAASRAMALLTVGTGIGGGLVLDGRLYRGSGGFGAEFGHIVVAEGGRRCPCGNRGCLEALASGTAIVATVGEWRARGAVPAGSPLAGDHAVTGTDVGRAAHAGDATARAVLDECGRWLGIGLAAVVNSLDPDLVVIGGGVAELGELLLGPARAALEPRVVGHGHRGVPPVVGGALGTDAGLVGAGLLALAESPGQDDARA